MSFTFCTSEAIIRKAGKKVNQAIVVSSAYLEQVSNEAENFINVYSMFDYIANYSILVANAKQILSECASNIGAIYLIQYDMSGYTGRGEAEDMITILRDRTISSLNLLKDDKYKTFLGAS